MYIISIINNFYIYKIYKIIDLFKSPNKYIKLLVFPNKQ